MKSEPLKKTVKLILIVAIVGFVLTALSGCGISYGPYRYGYDGRNYYKNADNYRSGYGYSGNASIAHEYNPDHRGYGSMRSYGPGRNGYCTW